MSNAPSVNRKEILPGFFEALQRFSYEDFFHLEKRSEKGERLHVPGYISAPENNFSQTLFFRSKDIMKAVYTEGKSYQNGDFFSYRGGDKQDIPPHEWQTIYPEIKELIAAHGDEVRNAFSCLFETCRKYEETRAESNSNKITQEEHGPSDEEAENLDIALHKIWKVVPQADPRILEGYEMVIAAEPLVLKAFPRYSFGNFTRCDKKIEEAFREGLALRKGDITQAQTYRDNFDYFKAQSPEIAELCLARFLRQTLRLDEDKNHCDFNSVENSTKVAQNILKGLDQSPDTIPAITERLKKAGYAPLQGKRSWMQNDDNRKKVLNALDYTEQYLEFCLDVKSGAWMEHTQKKLSRMIEVAAPPKQSATKATMTPVK